MQHENRKGECPKGLLPMPQVLHPIPVYPKLNLLSTPSAQENSGNSATELKSDPGYDIALSQRGYDEIEIESPISQSTIGGTSAAEIEIGLPTNRISQNSEMSTPSAQGFSDSAESFVQELRDAELSAKSGKELFDAQKELYSKRRFRFILTSATQSRQRRV